ncbi:hypothetical protein HDU78_008998 [Chytriomyces hyalinus]|nr:hypothetical protein HDU78_008998 [Chytriomyces hyalinus]
MSNVTIAPELPGFFTNILPKVASRVQIPWRHRDIPTQLKQRARGLASYKDRNRPISALYPSMKGDSASAAAQTGVR